RIVATTPIARLARPCCFRDIALPPLSSTRLLMASGLLPPLQKVAEQRFPLGRIVGRAGLFAQEGLEVGFLLLLPLRLGLLQHLLGGSEPGPARDRGGQIHVAPLRMEGRTL